MLVKKKNHFKNWRKTELGLVQDIVKNSDMLALADISGLPAIAARDFRKVLKDNGFKVKVSNVKIIKKALEEAGMKELVGITKGSIALIGGKGSPFSMYSLIKKNASNSGAKIGMTAPIDIVVPEGKTNIPPGPALSDFKAVKIDTQIRDGKIYVPRAYTVAKKGDAIDAKVVAILTKLNIKPIKVILKVKGAFDRSDKILYPLEVLDINIDAVRKDFIVAYQNAYFLAIDRAIVNKETIKPLIAKAYRNTKAVAVSQNIVTKETAGDILGKAQRIASAISKKTGN